VIFDPPPPPLTNVTSSLLIGEISSRKTNQNNTPPPKLTTCFSYIHGTCSGINSRACSAVANPKLMNVVTVNVVDRVVCITFSLCIAYILLTFTMISDCHCMRSVGYQIR